MSIREDLELDITTALGSVEELEAALTGAFAGAGEALSVTISELTSLLTDSFATAGEEGAASIATSISSIDATIVPTADTSDLEAAVTHAVEAGVADTNVTGLVDQIATAVEEGVVQGAGGGSDSAQAFDTITASADQAGDKIRQSLGEGSESAHALELAAASAAGSIGGVGRAALNLHPGVAKVAGLGIALFEVFGHAQKLHAAEERLNIVFGETAEKVEHIDVGGLRGDLDELVVKVGGAVPAFLEATAQIGQFGQASGASAAEIEQATSGIQALALRAVALKPGLGDAGDVAERLSKVLASGRTRGLVPFGLSLDTTAVKAKAAEIALAQGRTEVTRFDTAAAGAALITEDLGTKLGSDFEKGAQQSAVQLKALRAEIEETLAKAGQPLLQPLIEDAKVLAPVAEALGVSLATVLRVVTIIPAPLLQAGAAATVAVVAVKTLVPLVAGLADKFILSSGAALQAVFGYELAGAAAVNTAVAVEGAEAAMTGGLSLIVTGVAAAAAAFLFLGDSQDEAARSSESLTAELEASRDAANATGFAAAEAGKKFIETLDAGDFGKLGDSLTEDRSKLLNDLADIGVGVQRLNQDLGTGRKGLTDFARSMIEVRPPTRGAAKELRDLGLSQAEVAGLAAASKGGLEDLIDAAVNYGDVSNENRDDLVAFAHTIQDTTNRFKDQQKTIHDTAELNLRQIKATHQLTAAEKDQLDSGEDLIGLYDRVSERLGRLDAAKTAVLETDAKTDLLQTGLTDKLIKYGLTVDQLPILAEKFRADPAAIQELASAVQATIDGLVTAAESGLPTAADAFTKFSDDAAAAFKTLADAAGATKRSAADIRSAKSALVEATDPQRLIDNLQKQEETLASFNDNIDLLIAQGSTRTAAELFQLGATKGAALAEGLTSASPQVRAATETALLADSRLRAEAHERTLAQARTFADLYGKEAVGADGKFAFAIGDGSKVEEAVKANLRRTAAAFGIVSPEFRAAAEQLGLTQFEAYKTQTDRLGTTTARGVEAAKQALILATPGLSAAAATAALELANLYGINLQTISGATARALGAAVTAVQAAQPGLGLAGAAAAVAASGPILKGLSDIPAMGTRQFAALVARIRAANPDLTAAGAAAVANTAGEINKGLGKIKDGGETVRRSVIANIEDARAGGETKAREAGKSLGTQFTFGIPFGIKDKKALAAANGALDEVLVDIKATKADESKSSGKAIGKAFSEGLALGMSDNADVVASAARAVVREAEAAAKSEAEIKSPSKLFADIGHDIAAGDAQGIDKGKDLSADAAKSLVTATAEAAAKSAADQTLSFAQRLTTSTAEATRKALDSSLAAGEEHAISLVDRAALKIVTGLGASVTSIGAQGRAGLTTGQVTISDLVTPVALGVQKAIGDADKGLTSIFGHIGDRVGAVIDARAARTDRLLDEFVNGTRTASVTAKQAVIVQPTTAVSFPGAPSAAQVIAQQLNVTVDLTGLPANTTAAEARAIGVEIGDAVADTVAARRAVVATIRAN